MPKLTIIVGMAGSGKTWLCRHLAAQSVPPALAFWDATLAIKDKRRAGNRTMAEIVARLLGRSEDCVMDEAHLTSPEFRTMFKGFCDEFLEGVDQKWIFFEADTLACVNNIYRDVQEKGRINVSRFIALNEQRKIYQVPDEAEWPGRIVQPIHRDSNPRFTTIEEALAWIQEEITRHSPPSPVTPGKAPPASSPK